MEKHKLLTASNRENIRLTLSRVNVFKEVFVKKIVSTIQKDEVEKWLYGLDIAEKTRQHYRAAVISFFNGAKLT